MTESIALSIIFEAVLMIISIVVVLIGPGMIVGLIVSVFQAATQINEQTLSFLPRLIVTLIMIVVAGPWIIERLKTMFENLFFNIPGYIG
jgi:flagellar biosynthetic protein FliQ